MTTLELKGKSESMTRFKVVILSEIAILTDEGFNYTLNARTVNFLQQNIGINLSKIPANNI